MAFAPIKKDAIGIKVSPNFTDYERTCAEFSWTASERELSKFPAARGLNIAFECVDRHAQGLRRDHRAFRWVGKQGEVRDFAYGHLQRLSNRFANVLRTLGIGKGDRVFALAGRVPELYVTALGTLKNGSVFCPLFSAFGPEPIHQRLSIGEGNVLVTTEALYSRRKSVTETEMRQVVRQALGNVAPEAGLDAIDPAKDLRDQIDIDSVDFLNFVIGLHKELNVDIPDTDVAKLTTLNGCVAYLLAKTGRS